MSKLGHKFRIVATLISPFKKTLTDEEVSAVMQ
jgi:hypothetical protein